MSAGDCQQIAAGAYRQTAGARDPEGAGAAFRFAHERKSAAQPHAAELLKSTVAALTGDFGRERNKPLATCTHLSPQVIQIPRNKANAGTL